MIEELETRRIMDLSHATQCIRHYLRDSRRVSVSIMRLPMSRDSTGHDRGDQAGSSPAVDAAKRARSSSWTVAGIAALVVLLLLLLALIAFTSAVKNCLGEVRQLVKAVIPDDNEVTTTLLQGYLQDLERESDLRVGTRIVNSKVTTTRESSTEWFGVNIPLGKTTVTIEVPGNTIQYIIPLNELDITQSRVGTRDGSETLIITLPVPRVDTKIVQIQHDQSQWSIDINRDYLDHLSRSENAMRSATAAIREDVIKQGSTRFAILESQEAAAETAREFFRKFLPANTAGLPIEIQWQSVQPTQPPPKPLGASTPTKSLGGDTALNQVGGGAAAKTTVPVLFPPRAYLCQRAPTPPTLDGDLDESAWGGASWTVDFTDIQGPSLPTPRLRTRAKMLWDSANLYIAAQLQEPHVWASLRQHDEIVFQDNDFEVFIDPDGDTREYYEIEVNALGTIFDLYLHRRYKEEGPSEHGWDAAGLKTAITVQGTLNDSTDEDSGWTLEWAIPWTAFLPPALKHESFTERARSAAPPRAGDEWRLNFSRVQWHCNHDQSRDSTSSGSRSNDAATNAYSKTKGLPEDNWVWSPQWQIDMHDPQFWGRVQFLD
ncbi:MAG: hypothetical protein EXS00_08580 [Phycisphaerales bacterium]|nr:hypothetical protein [Phycisphaerales bacterium]